jgi:hypothetical protein
MIKLQHHSMLSNSVFSEIFMAVKCVSSQAISHDDTEPKNPMF